MTRAAFGGYGDWPAFMAETPRVPGRLGELFGVPEPGPVDVRERVVHEGGGVCAVRLRWSPGFGPDAAAWLLHPRGVDPATLPGVLALHSHGGITCVGAERMVDVPGLPAHVVEYRCRCEDGAAAASDLARAGFTVLAPDAFGSGSRRFDLGAPTALAHDEASREHEHLVAKACALLDTSWAGMVAHGDLIALGVLQARCAPGGVGAWGFSGGGGRAALVAALDTRVRAVVVVAMMCTMASLFPDHLAHSWLLHTRGLASGPDLPGLLAARADAHAMVGYAGDDPLFPRAGMRAADELLARAFAGCPGSYTPVWVNGPHVFTRELQRHAREHLTAALQPAASHN